MSPHALGRLQRHRRAFGGGDWWLTPAETTRLLGWPRQATYRLMQTGLVQLRRMPLADARTIVRLRGVDVIAYCRSRNQ